MRIIQLSFISILIIGVISCSTLSKYKSHELVRLSKNNNVQSVSFGNNNFDRLALFPCKNETKQLDVNAIIDSVLQNQLPIACPDIFRLNKSTDSYNYAFYVKVNSIRRNEYGSMFDLNRPHVLYVHLSVNLVIVDLTKEKPIWNRKAEPTIYRSLGKSYNDINSPLTYNETKLLSLQLVEAIHTAMNILELPSNLQIELNDIISSKDYNFSVESMLKFYNWFGTDIKKNKLDYKIEYNNNKIYLPLKTNLLTHQNYNNFIIFLKECNLYYEEFIEKEKGYL